MPAAQVFAAALPLMGIIPEPSWALPQIVREQALGTFFFFFECFLRLIFQSVYVALTYTPGGGLLAGFAMRGDPNVAFGSFVVLSGH